MTRTFLILNEVNEQVNQNVKFRHNQTLLDSMISMDKVFIATEIFFILKTGLAQKYSSMQY